MVDDDDGTAGTRSRMCSLEKAPAPPPKPNPPWPWPPPLPPEPGAMGDCLNPEISLRASVGWSGRARSVYQREGRVSVEVKLLLTGGSWWVGWGSLWDEEE